MQEGPVLHRFRPVDLGPRLHQAPWRNRQRSTKEFEVVDREHGGLVLIVGVEVRWRTAFSREPPSRRSHHLGLPPLVGCSSAF